MVKLNSIVFNTTVENEIIEREVKLNFKQHNYELKDAHSGDHFSQELIITYFAIYINF